MLIISKFKDYYDSVSSLGIDKTIVYERHEKEYNGKHLWHKTKSKYRWQSDSLYEKDFHLYWTKGNDLTIMPFHFCVCGKSKLCYRVVIRDNNFVYSTFYFYDAESLINKLITLRSLKEQDIDDIKKSFKYFDKEDHSVNLFFNSPVIVYSFEKNSFFINTRLQDYSFFKVFDSYSAFQNIQSYISGVLGIPDNPMIEINEKDKVMSKGFNKWSFRNPDPPKRKQKK